MDPNDDKNIFNFLNRYTTIQMDKQNDIRKANDVTMLNGNMTNHGSIGGSFTNDYNLLKKDFKAMNICEQSELSSTGASDKSLSSFGSESNDSNGCESNSGPHDSILSTLVGMVNESNGSQMRESSQSPAFFGFSSSNSSSPPLSGPSSASSLSESISTLANGSNNSQKNANIDFSFNTFSNPSRNFGTRNNNDTSSSSSTLFANPLDNMFGSMLTSNGVNHGRNETIDDTLSALLDGSTTFDPCPVDQRRFHQSGSNTNSGPNNTSFSQETLPQFLQNSFSPFGNGINETSNTMTNGVVNNGRNKFSLFGANGNSNGASTSTISSNTTTLSSPISSLSLFSSSNSFLFNETLEQGNLMQSNPNVNLQSRFESHVRSIASEINSTVQLYTSSLQMRKEQLIKQLEHVRNTYVMLLQQSKNKPNNQIPFPRITFSRPDSALFKLVTSFGYLNSPAFAPYCIITGEGLTVSVEGEPTCFSIATKNCFNEELLNGGETIDIDIQPIDSTAHHNGSTFMPSIPNIQKNVIDNNNGKYNVTYIIPRGSNLRSVKIYIQINGLPASKSPFLATIKTERVRECWKRVALYGEEGAEPGKFCRPWGVAMVGLPLAKDQNHKPVGGEANQTIPSASKQFYSWNCSSKNKRDYLLTVADRSNNRIQLLKLCVSDSNSPSENSMYSGNFILNTNVDISVLHVFGSGPGTRPGQFDRPAGIAINSNFGQIIVVDKDNHRIQVFDLTGNFLFKFGEKGSRAGQFCYPWDIAICPQTSLILVSDTRNRRIQLFTHFGQHLWHCGQPLDSPRGVAFLSPERYIVSDFNKHRILIIDRNENAMHNLPLRDDMINSKYIGFGEGSAWGEFLRPQGLVASVNNGTNFPGTGVNKFVHILCADSRNNRIAIWNSLNQNFEYINDENAKGDSISSVTTSFDRPSGIAMADNMLAVVDFGNNRLQLFQKSSA
ncbi:E3 ubiquitin-protein ligase trim71 [Blomia tropicalis]|nr:E3 ubiquitin-protein ligase trim71 [Blomia tropicalis]